jgi:hypothetical protein
VELAKQYRIGLKVFNAIFVAGSAFLSERDIIPEKIIPEPIVMPDGMFQCPRCNQTFETRDIYEDHFTAEHE